MPTLPYDVLPPPGWEPKSPYFKWVVAKYWSKPMNDTPTPPIAAKLAFCPACDAAFLQHAGRQWSVCHGVDPVLTYDLEGLFEAVNLLMESARTILPPSASDVPVDGGGEGAGSTAPPRGRGRRPPPEPDPGAVLRAPELAPASDPAAAAVSNP